jgi:hypothetical protein
MGAAREGQSEHLFELCVTLRFPQKLPNADPKASSRFVSDGQ